MKIIRDLKQKKKFLKIIEKNFSKICIAYDGTKLKYCDILSYTIQINKYLVKNSLENKTVITQFKNRLHAFIFYIAAIFSKTTICPLDPKLPPYRVNKIKRLIKAKKIIKKINFSKKIISNTSSLNLNNHKFLITFSSGTSGNPKGIIHDSENILGVSFSYSKIAKFNKNTRILHCIPEYYMAGIVNIFFSCLCVGAKVIIVDTFNKNTLFSIWKYISKYFINVIYLIPSIYSMISNFSPMDVTRIIKKNNIKFFSTSNYLYPNIRKTFFKKFKRKIRSCYGITEMGGPLTNEIKPSLKFDSVGEPINGCKIKIKKVNKINTLFIKSIYQCKNLIINQRVEKIKTDKYGYFNSQDTGHFKKKDLIINGRVKDILKKGGEFVNLVDIENVLSENNFIAEVAAVSINDDLSDEKLYIYIVSKLKKIKEENIKSLLNTINKKMYKTERPNKIIFLKRMPKTSSGKIIKRKLILSNAKDKIKEIIL